jgi:hypothetical protein
MDYNTAIPSAALAAGLAIKPIKFFYPRLRRRLHTVGFPLGFAVFYAASDPFIDPSLKDFAENWVRNISMFIKVLFIKV